MDHCIRSLCLDHRCHCVTAAVSSPSFHHLVTHLEPLCTVHRCWQRRLHYPGITPSPCLTPITVLARRDPEQYYYMAVVRQEEEPGIFLLEFNEPHNEGGLSSTALQRTDAADIIQYNEAMRHAIVPGDNVLAPWEPDRTRYRPGTVISGLENRDPLRALEDEELAVRSGEGTVAHVPLMVAVWISPSVYRRIVERLHHPISSCAHRQATSTYVMAQHCAPLCSAGSACCCHPKCQGWWPLSPKTSVYIQGKPSDQERRSPGTGRGGRSSSSSSSSSSQGTEEESLDEEDTHSTLVDSATNTDSSLWEWPRVAARGRPDWQYWRRSQPEPFYRKPGAPRSKNTASDARAAELSNATGLSNQSALFETISHSPAQQLTMKDVLLHTESIPARRVSAPSPKSGGFPESEAEKLRHKKLLEKRERKIQHGEWERQREDAAGRKYCAMQETHRVRTWQRVLAQEQQLKEQDARNVASLREKMAAHNERLTQRQTLAAEDRKREERRLHHLRNVRQNIDQREYEKCTANEQREISHMAAQRRRVQTHYKELAERVFQAERGAQYPEA